MRSRDLTGAVYDALEAAQWVVALCADITSEQFIRSEVIRSAAERKLEIIGEALSRAARSDPAIGDVIPDLRRIIGLRNVLAHGYDVVDPHEIYLIITSRVPELVAALHQLSDMEVAE